MSELDGFDIETNAGLEQRYSNVLINASAARHGGLPARSLVDLATYHRGHGGHTTWSMIRSRPSLFWPRARRGLQTIDGLRC